MPVAWLYLKTSHSAPLVLLIDPRILVKTEELVDVARYDIKESAHLHCLVPPINRPHTIGKVAQRPINVRPYVITVYGFQQEAHLLVVIQRTFVQRQFQQRLRICSTHCPRSSVLKVVGSLI